jgi:hypothetical protein
MATCATCGMSFEPQRYQRKGKYCSTECYYARGPDGPRKASVKRPRRVMAKGHPLADGHGRVALSRLRLYDKIGPDPHPCHWCGRIVVWTLQLVTDSLVADHLDWDNTNDAPENLVPSCHSCNARRAAPGRRGGIQPGEPIVMIGKHRTRAVERICKRCGVTFLAAPSAAGTYCSQACRLGRVA